LWLHRTGVQLWPLHQEFITPHTPEQNGMVKRVIRTCEAVVRTPPSVLDSVPHAGWVIGGWISFYNHIGPHQALGMKTPAATNAF